MSGLATRCPACGTVFRVVPDQLRVSEGWVRCGRCADVFNAAQALLDLDTGAPLPAPADAAPAMAPAAPGPRPPPLAPPPAPAPSAVAVGPERPPAEEPIHITDYEPPAHAAAATAVPPPEVVPDALPDPVATPEDRLPSFVRRAESEARWQQPRVRAALAGACVLALTGLLGQAAYIYRDGLAARIAAIRPPLEAGCALLGCTVGAPHAIDSLSVESSGLVRVEKSNVYRLSVALRNRAGTEVALPALDLTLTDAQGKLLARRVLRGSEFGVKQTTLAAGHDLALQATLDAAFSPPGEVIAGYTIELFYP